MSIFSQESWSEASEVTVVGGTTSSRVEDLKPDAHYLLRVKAVNHLGASSPSETLQVHNLLLYTLLLLLLFLLIYIYIYIFFLYIYGKFSWRVLLFSYLSYIIVFIYSIEGFISTKLVSVRHLEESEIISTNFPEVFNYTKSEFLTWEDGV